MKPDNFLVKIAASVVLVLLWGVIQVPAQTRLRSDTKGKGGGVLVIRLLTGNGPRALMKAPDLFGGASRSRTGPREWVEMGVQYDTDPEWIDEVAFQYYALLLNRATREYTLLKGSAAYIDVARGKGHMGVAYIRPSALARYGEVTGVAVEVLVKGEVVASRSEGKLSPGKSLPEEWWKSPKLTPKEGYILDKAKTPFALVNYDDYESLK